jgi:hypothetical protein
LDSGASKHIVKSKENLVDVEKSHRQLSGVFGDSVRIEQQGNLDLTGEEKLFLKEALFHPKAKLNLVSVTRLMRDNGLNVLFDKDQMEATIFDPDQNNKVVARATLQENDLFRVVLNSEVVGVVEELSCSFVDSATNWHKRLGHLSLRKMQELHRMGNIKILIVAPN